MALIDDFVAALQQSNRRLFHFTDSRNIPGILEQGLLPTQMINEQGLQVITGGDAGSLHVDRQKGLDGHVSLSFCRSHPMAHVARVEGRIEIVRILTICPSVLLRPGVLFSNQVATANDAKIASPNEMIPLMDLHRLTRVTQWHAYVRSKRRGLGDSTSLRSPCRCSPSGEASLCRSSQTRQRGAAYKNGTCL